MPAAWKDASYTEARGRGRNRRRALVECEISAPDRRPPYDSAAPFFRETAEGRPGVPAGEPGLTVHVPLKDLETVLEHAERLGGTILVRRSGVPGLVTVAVFPQAPHGGRPLEDEEGAAS